MKKILALFSLAFALTTFAQSDGYTFLVDSNGFGLSGFYINASNIVGYIPATNFTNVVSTAQLNTFSNQVATNILGQSLVASNATAMVSNQLALFQTVYTGTGNYMVGATNSGILGGLDNTISAGTPLTDSSWIVGGQHNFINGQSLAAGIFCGVSNLVSQGYESGIFCGIHNWYEGGPGGAILAGFGNVNSAYSDVIICGINNVAYNYSSSPGVLDYASVVLNGTNNQVGGAFDVVGGADASAFANGDFVFADWEGNTNFAATGNNQVLFRCNGGFGIGTNAPGTNQLAVAGNSDFFSLSCQGTNIMGLFSGLSVLWNYNLTGASNALNASTIVVSNLVTSVSNNDVVSSNALKQFILTVSNNIVVASNAIAGSVAGITTSKAFTASLPATYASIGIGFNNPLMPDGNYSVELEPQDQSTASAPNWSMAYWVGSKTSSGFTIYASFATNAYNLNFDVIVKENTQ
jgi:hypothetical protein